MGRAGESRPTASALVSIDGTGPALGGGRTTRRDAREEELEGGIWRGVNCDGDQTKFPGPRGGACDAHGLAIVAARERRLGARDGGGAAVDSWFVGGGFLDDGRTYGPDA